MKPLVEFYDSLLESLSCEIDPDTRAVSTHYNNEYVPAYVKKRRLLAISQDLVRNGMEDLNKQVAFHPLSESTASEAMSDVHQWLLLAIRVRLNSLMQSLAVRIMEVATSPELQSKMKASEAARYKALNNADAKTLTALTNILEAVEFNNANRCLVHVRVKKGGQLGGKVYGRVVYVTFPILNELEEAVDSVYGVQVRKKDVPVLRALFESVILNDRGGEITEFSAANTTLVAPYLSSMLNAYYNVLTRLNSVRKDHGTILNCTGLPVNIDWYPAISDFDKLRQMVPQLDGNIGVVTERSSGVVKTSTTAPETVVSDDRSVEEVTGIAAGVQHADDTGSVAKNWLRATPIDGAMRMPHSAVPAHNDPLAMPVNTGVDTDSMSPEQFNLWRTQQAMLTGGQSAYGQPAPFVRGRDLYLQNQQQQLMPQHGMYQQPMPSQTGGITIIGTAPCGNPLARLPDGNIAVIQSQGNAMQPPTTGYMQPAAPQAPMNPSAAGAWAAFAK